jgi:PilZ domain
MRSDSVALHPHDEELGLYLLERLPADSLSTMDAHLANCSACDQRLVQEIRSLSEAGVSQLGAALTDEMRKEPRYKTDETVSLQTLSPFSPDRVSGRLADVSRSGMKLQIPMRVECGTLIRISLKNMIAFGEVRYCVQVGDAFHFGMQVSQTVQLSNHE